MSTPAIALIKNRTAAVAPVSVEHLPYIIDQTRIFPDKEIGQFIDPRRKGRGATLKDGLTPTSNAFVGLYLEKEPSRRDKKRLQRGDLQDEVPFFRSI